MRQKSAPSHVDLAHRYARDVVTGKIPACKWVNLACQRHLDDLKKKDWRYRFDRQKAERVCKFVELLPHTKGAWAAKQEQLLLQPWQLFILCSVFVFGWVQKGTGLRRFREAFLECPRKNGKSVLSAVIGLYMLCADGELAGKYTGATTEKQAWEVFRPAQLMAKRTPDLQEEFGITISASNLAILDNGSRFEPLIGSPGDGASPSCALIDEYHEHTSDDLYETMVTGMGAREQPLVFIVTTAGSNLAGPCYRKRDYLCQVLEKVIENDKLFGIIYGLDDADDWTDPASLRKANPNYDVSVNEDYLLSRQREAMQSASRQNAFKTKHLNQWVGAAFAWMDMLLWRACPPRKPLAELTGRDVFIGVDLASVNDLAAVALLFPPTADDPLYHLFGRYYLPEDVVDNKRGDNVSHYDTWAKQGLLTLTPGNAIDYDAIYDDIMEFRPQFSIKAIAFDEWNAHGTYTRLVKEFPERKLPNGDLDATVLKVSMNTKTMSDPMKQFEVLIRKKLLAHGNCPLMTWMISNVVAEPDRKDNLYPRKEFYENKIDGAIAAFLALGRIIVLPEKKVSKYESGGLTLL